MSVPGQQSCDGTAGEPRRDLIAHRGFAALSPENTLPALRRAAAHPRTSGVECDLRRCGSGEVVVRHDATVDRVTDGEGRVADHAREELAALSVLGGDAGVPTLGEVVAAVPADVTLHLEVNYPTLLRSPTRGSLVEGGALMWTPGDQLSAVGR